MLHDMKNISRYKNTKSAAQVASKNIAMLRLLALLGGLLMLVFSSHAYADFIIGTFGDDVLQGGDGNDQIFGLKGNDKLYGKKGVDYLIGGKGDDELNGGAGNDILQGGPGSDIHNGGAGNGDFVFYYYSPASVTVKLDGSPATGGHAQGDTLISIEDLAGSLFGDHLTGNSENNYISGHFGNDQIFGKGGDDELYGRVGNDELHGGGGIDYLDGGLGNDVLYGGGSDDQLRGGPGADVYDGGPGNGDFANYYYSPAGVTVKLDGSVASGGFAEGDTLTNIEDLAGSLFNDHLTGNSDNNYISGQLGNDQIFGKAGDDELYGRMGDDVIHGGSGNDYLRGGKGNDQIFGQGGNDKLYGGRGSDELHGGNGNDLLRGGRGNDQLFGGNGDDELRGGKGADILDGGDGDADFAVYYYSKAAVTVKLDASVGIGGQAEGDTLINIEDLAGSIFDDDLSGNADDNYISGQAGNDKISGKAGDDELYGRSGRDKLRGGKGDDQLYGGDGRDVLRGNKGNDTLRGQSGNDVYWFERGDDIDTIIDSNGQKDTLKFGDDISQDQLWFSQLGNDLAIYIIDTDDHVIIKDWYTDGHDIEYFELEDDAFLLDTNVQILVDAMSVVVPVPGQVLTIDEAILDDLEDIIDDAWTDTNPNTDEDDDGVPNDEDECPDTPPGEIVDEDGCSSTQIDSDGDGVNDAYDAFPNDPNRTQLPAVESLSAVLSSVDEHIQVQWQTPADPENIASYHVYRTVGDSDTPDLIATVALDSAISAYSVIDSNIQNAQVYAYQVLAVTASGLEGIEATPVSVSALWNNVTVTSLVATRVPVDAQLQWDHLPGHRYRIYKSIDGAAFEVLAESNEAQYLDSDTLWNLAYQYRVSTLLDLTDPVSGATVTLEGSLSDAVSIYALPLLEINLFDAQKNGNEYIKIVANQNDIALSGEYLNSVGPVEITAVSGTGTASQTVSDTTSDGAFRLLVPFTQNNALWVLTVNETSVANRSATINIRISIDDVGPVVTIDGAAQVNTSDDEVTTNGSASDNSGQVSSIILNSDRMPGVPFAATTLGNNRFSAAIPLMFGDNIITATARDELGNEGSAQVQVTREIDSAPSLEILFPQNASTVNQQAITISGRLYTSLAPENIRVTLGERTIFPQAGNTAGVYGFQFNVQLQTGANDFIVRAETTAGNTSAALTVFYQPENPQTLTPPLLQITQPTIKTFTNEDSIIIAGSVAVVSAPISLTINGQAVDLLGQTDMQGNFQYAEDISTLNGETTYTITALDGANQSTTKTITITRDTDTPVITISNNGLSESPVVNTVIEQPYRLLGNVSDANLASLTLNGQPVELLPTVSPTTFDFDLGLQLPPGQDRTVIINARDYAGNTSELSYVFNAALQTEIEIISPLENAEVLLDASNATIEAVVRLSNADPSFTVNAQVDQGAAQAMQRDETMYTATLALDLSNDQHTLSINVSDQNSQVIATTSRQFTTKDLSNVPLALIKTEPASNEKGVEPNVSLNFYFNKPIDPALLTIAVTETANGLTYDTSRPEPAPFPSMDNIRATEVYRNQEPVPSELGFLPGNSVVMVIPSRDIAYGADVYIKVDYDGQELTRYTYQVREVPSFLQGILLNQIGQPAVDIEVSLPDLNMTTTTDNEGSYAFGFGLDADNALPPGRHKIVYNSGMKSNLYGEVTRWADVQRGMLNRMTGVSIPLINTDVPYQRINHRQSDVSLIGGELRFDLSAADLKFPNGRRSGDIHVQFSTASQLSYHFLDSAVPQWLFVIHPSGIEVDGRIETQIKMPPLLGSTAYIPANGTYVLIIGLDTRSRMLVPVGVGRVEDQHVIARLKELQVLDQIGYALVGYDDNSQALFKQYLDGEVDLRVLIQQLENNQEKN